MKVVVISDTKIDEYINVDDKSNDVIEYKTIPSGYLFNSCLLLSKWGLDTSISGVSSNSIISDTLINYNINIDNLIIKDNLSNKRYILYNNINNNKKVLNYINKCNESINIDLDSDYLIISNNSYNIDIKLLEEYKGTIILVINYYDINILEYTKYAKYIICSLEFSLLSTKVRLDFNDVNSLKVVINKLEDMYNSKFIITLGNKGCLYKVDDKVKIMGSLKVSSDVMMDARGVFSGAFVYGLSEELNIEKCLKIATIASGLYLKDSKLPDIMEVYNIYGKNK